jgi:hypothetical protein
MNEVPTKITTPDLYFAAYLRAKSCQIIDMQREGSKTIFVFDISDSKLTTQQLRQGFFNSGTDKNLAVVSIMFADSIRTLKTLCHVEDYPDIQKLVTPDLYFAAYLKTKNCAVASIKQKDSKTAFVFDVAPSGMSIIELKLGYFNSVNNERCTVNASSYTDAVRSLKTMCHITSDI